MGRCFQFRHSNFYLAHPFIVQQLIIGSHLSHHVIIQFRQFRQSFQPGNTICNIRRKRHVDDTMWTKSRPSPDVNMWTTCLPMRESAVCGDVIKSSRIEACSVTTETTKRDCLNSFETYVWWSTVPLRRGGCTRAPLSSSIWLCPLF